MARIIVLDTAPLGLLAHSRDDLPAAMRCRGWLDAVQRAGSVVVVPEIADYEVRRELLRLDNRRGLARLDRLTRTLNFLPITTAEMRRAAQLWAFARRDGEPTADPLELDCDVILAAQAELIAADPRAVVVATSNVRHLSRFVAADFWADIDGT